MKKFENILKFYSKNMKPSKSAKDEVYSKVFNKPVENKTINMGLVRNFVFFAFLIVFVPAAIFQSGIVNENKNEVSFQTSTSDVAPAPENAGENLMVDDFYDSNAEMPSLNMRAAETDALDYPIVNNSIANYADEDIDTQFEKRAQEYSASLELATEKPMEHWNYVKSLVDDNDGYIVTSNYDSKYSAQAKLTARIPSAKFDKFLNSIREMDLDIIAEDISSIDLQNQLTETETTQSEVKQKISELENELKETKDANEKRRIEEELKSYRNTDAYLTDEIVELNKRASYSTISVSLSEKQSDNLLENVWLDVEDTAEFVVKFWAIAIMVGSVPLLLIWLGFRKFRAMRKR